MVRMMPLATRVLGRRFLTSSARPTSIGFLGMGAMGGPMLNNVTRKSLKDGRATKIIAYDISAKALEAWKRERVAEDDIDPSALILASSPAEVSEQAQTIISMLPAAPQVRDVYLNPETGLLKGMANLAKPDVDATLFLDATTGEQAVSIDVAAQVQGRGARYLDCPVSGGTVGAAAGTLAFMCGGEKEAFERALPYLQYMGGRIVHAGKVGNGLAAKIANNLLLGISMLGTAEAMLLGIKLGLEPKMLADIINSSSGRCWSSEINNPAPAALEKGAPADRDYNGGFQVKLMSKDLKLALAAAKLSGTELIVGKKTAEVYGELEASNDYATKDFSSVFKMLSRASSA